MAAQKKQRPLIRYAGSAAETSIGSKPIGSELNARVYPERPVCQAELTLAQTRAYLPNLRKITEPNGKTIPLTLCPIEIFHFTHSRRASQSSEPNASFCRAAKGLPQEQNRWPR